VTTASNYDTQLAFLVGTCGGSTDTTSGARLGLMRLAAARLGASAAAPGSSGWELVSYNDNNGPLITSGATRDMSEGEEIYVLVFGYGPDDDLNPLMLKVTVTWAPELPPVDPEEPPTLIR